MGSDAEKKARESLNRLYLSAYEAGAREMQKQAAKACRAVGVGLPSQSSYNEGRIDTAKWCAATIEDLPLKIVGR